MQTSLWDKQLHNWSKESTTSNPCITVRTHWTCCCSSSALPRQGQALSCGRKNLFNPCSLWNGTNPVNTWSCQLCQHCHGSAVQHSRGQQCLEGKRLETDGTRPHYWSTRANISTKPQQLSVVSRISTAFSTNKQPSKARWEHTQAGHLPEGRTLYCKVKSH